MAWQGMAGGGHTPPVAPGKGPYKTVSDSLAHASGELKDLYHAVDDYLQALGDDVTRKVLKYYVAFKRIKNFACVEVFPQSKKLVILVKVQPTPETIVEGFTRDVRNIGHLGTGELEISIASMEDFERAKPLLDQSYQAS